ncbi:Nucleic-acid-binding protein from transposon X-element [Lucilia cuprina]|nr:Nucleic-acid-binding protein from transposon X-element [Lucilia cuprina]
MAKNLHYSCDTNSIINDLKAQGFNIIEVMNKHKFKTKEPLNMFILTFDSSEDITKVYKIKHILNNVVNIEPIKQHKMIPQCKKCQGFGHTKNYCNKPPRCVKCAGKHLSIECNVEIEHPKCCNCGENHPATYRGCIVAKELQKLRNKSRPRNDMLSPSSNPTVKRVTFNTETNTYPPNISQQKTFAEVTKMKQPDCTPDILSQILSRLNMQQNFFKTIEQRLALFERNYLKNGKFP